MQAPTTATWGSFSKNTWGGGGPVVTKQQGLLLSAQKRIPKRRAAAPNPTLIHAGFSPPTTNVSHSRDQASLLWHRACLFSTRPEWRSDRVSMSGLINLTEKPLFQKEKSSSKFAQLKSLNPPPLHLGRSAPKAFELLIKACTNCVL